MRRKQRWFRAGLCLLFALCICAPMGLPTRASGAQTYADGYNDSLALVGLTHERYLTMDPATQSIYSAMTFASVSAETKYYRVTENADGASQSGEPVTEEISAEQYELETRNGQPGCELLLETPAFSEKAQTTSWITMTTRLAKGAEDRWVLCADVTSLDSAGGAAWDATDVIALQVGSQCTMIENSEYLHRYRRFFSPKMGIEEVRNDYPSVPVRTGIGFAAYYNIPKEERDHSVYFLVALTTNTTEATTVDGYVHYARREMEVDPFIDIRSDGASLSLSPSRPWKRISSGRMRLEVN